VSKTRSPLPRGATQAIARLGADLRNARRRRRLPMAYVKVERGDPGVSLGICASVLFGYGMIERLEHLMPRRIRNQRAPSALAARA
jgi:hypothetical protein